MPTFSHSSSLVISLLEVNKRQEIYHFFLCSFLSQRLITSIPNIWSTQCQYISIYPMMMMMEISAPICALLYYTWKLHLDSKHFFGATLPSWVVHLVWKIRAHSNFCLSIANHHHYSCLPAMSWNCTALEKEMHCPFSFLCACSTAHLNRHSSFLLFPI